VWHHNPSINAVANYPARPTIIEKMKLMNKNGIYMEITRHGNMYSKPLQIESTGHSIFQQTQTRSEIIEHGNTRCKPAHIDSAGHGIYQDKSKPSKTCVCNTINNNKHLKMNRHGMFEQPSPHSKITRHGIYAVYKCAESSGALAQNNTVGLKPPGCVAP
jgi:hypothetical protein